MIRAVIFDMGDTLVTSLGTAKIYQKILEKKGVKKTTKQIQAAHDKGEKAFKERHTGAELMAMSLEEFYGEWNLEVVKQLKVEDEKLAKLIQEKWFETAELKLFDDAKPVLNRLSAMGLYLGIVSNGYEEEIEEVMGLVGLNPGMFSVTVGRDTTGADKPDPRPFLHAAGSLGLRPSEVLFVGDSFRKDYEGAQGTGMTPVLLLRGKSPPPEAPKDINKIETLDELVNFIR